MKQVITINPDGSCFSLQHKKGKGLDLRKLGKPRISRVTNIEFNDKSQQWYITWKNDKLDTEFNKRQGTWGADLFTKVGIYFKSLNGIHGFLSTVMFDDYDDAVKAEIAVIQEMQMIPKYNNILQKYL